MAHVKNRFSKIIALCFGALCLIFLIVGYLKSDSIFYNNLIKSNNLTTPLQVFNWTTKHFGTPKTPVSYPYLSPDI